MECICTLFSTFRINSLYFVRFKKIPHRKPFWVPKAKTKVFIVHQPPPIIEEDYELMTKRSDHYRAQMATVRAYLTDHYEKHLKKKETEDPSIVPENEPEFHALLRDNDSFNNLSSLFRKSREASGLVESQLVEFRERMLSEAQRRVDSELIEEEIAIAKASAPHYITDLDLEAQLSLCLDRRVEYNFAMDRQGRIYKRDLLPADFETDDGLTLSIFDDVPPTLGAGADVPEGVDVNEGADVPEGADFVTLDDAEASSAQLESLDDELRPQKESVS